MGNEHGSPRFSEKDLDDSYESSNDDVIFSKASGSQRNLGLDSKLAAKPADESIPTPTQVLDVIYKEEDDIVQEADIGPTSFPDESEENDLGLPEELLAQIFFYLFDVTNMKTLLTVCKLWRRVADSGQQWKRVFVGLGLDQTYKIADGLDETSQYLLRKALVRQKPFSTSILVLGLPGHGKTSFVRRFGTNEFIPAIPSKFSNQSAKRVMLMRNPVSKKLEAVEVELWDPQSPYGTVVSPEERYYRHQPAIIILYDINDPQSNRLSVGYFDEISRYCDCSPRILFAASKCDLLDAEGFERVACWNVGALKTRLIQYGSSVDHDIIGTMDTSAKSGLNVFSAVKSLAKTVWTDTLKDPLGHSGETPLSNSGGTKINTDRNSFNYGK